MKFKEMLKKWNPKYPGMDQGAQTYFAKEVGVSRETVSRWVKGKAVPEEALRYKIATALGCTVAELMTCFTPSADIYKLGPTGGDAVSEYPFRGIATQLIPVVGYIDASTSECSCVFEANMTPVEVLMITAPGQRVEALKVHGTELLHVLDGEYAIVAKDAAYVNGSSVVVKIKGKCCLKRIYTFLNKIILVSRTKKADRIEIKKEDLQMLGVVLRFVREDEPVPLEA